MKKKNYQGLTVKLEYVSALRLYLRSLKNKFLHLTRNFRLGNMYGNIFFQKNEKSVIKRMNINASSNVDFCFLKSY